MNKIKNGIIQGDEIFGIPFRTDLIPKSNKTSRPGIKITPSSGTAHNTGNRKRGANAKMHTEYVDHTSQYVSWHITIDDKEIIQELPLDEMAFHAGDGRNGPGNRTSIAVEICEHEGIDWELAKENAAKFFHFLFVVGIIDSVVPHQKWSGKYCPHRILDEGWDKFTALIKHIEKTFAPLDDISPWAIDGREYVMLHGISDGTRPKDLPTREEIWSMLYNHYNTHK